MQLPVNNNHQVESARKATSNATTADAYDRPSSWMEFNNDRTDEATVDRAWQLDCPPPLTETHDNAVMNWIERFADHKTRTDAADGAADVDISVKRLGRDAVTSTTTTIQSKHEPTRDVLQLLTLLGYSTSVSRDRAHQQLVQRRNDDKRLQYLRQFPKLHDSRQHNADLLAYKDKLVL